MDGERLALTAFLTGSLLAGGNAVGIRFSNRELEPFWGAGLRFGLAALMLLAVMAVMRLAWPRGQALLGALVYGALNFGVAFALAYYALVELQAGFGQILLAIVPLLTLLVAVLERQERFRLVAGAGALLALTGILVLSKAQLAGELPWLSLLAALGSALCFAQAAVVVRRFPPVHPVVMNAVGMGAGALLLLLIALIAGDAFAVPERAATWLAVAYLVVVGSGAVFILYLIALKYWAASRAAYTFVVIPVVTVALSAWLDDEPVDWGLVLGGLLVVAGVYVGALQAPRSARAAQPRAGGGV